MTDSALRSETRDCDTPARLGGDEFALLLNHTPATGAKACASKLVALIASLAVPFENHTLRLGASVGIALYPDHGRSVPTLFAAADAALYESKQLGRNRASICLQAAGDDVSIAFPMQRRRRS